MVIVLVGQHEETADEQRAADLIEARLTARGISLVSMHDARDRIQAKSRAPLAPDATDLDVLAREAHAAVEHVAFGRNAAAKRSVEEVFQRAERALESLNRETKNARAVLDACLALVRSTLTRGERQEALDMAMRCRRLVPDVAPSEFTHPASVIGVLAEADNQLRRMHIGQLNVSSLPESGCATYVNGRHLGVTPFRLDRAAEGEYRVQVECGRTPGRVHLVHLGEDPVELEVDTELDRALRTESRVALVYDNVPKTQQLASRHGALVARSVRAEEALLISSADAYVQLTRVSVAQGSTLARVHLRLRSLEDASRAELDRGLDALFEGRVEKDAPVDLSVSQSATDQADCQSKLVPRAHSSEQDASRRKLALRITSASLAAAGAALFVTGVFFEHQRKDAKDKLVTLDPADADASSGVRDDLEHDKKLRWLAVPGGALLTAAVPLARVDVSRGVPWWSYIVGSAGLGLAAWGAVELAKDGKCEIPLATRGCADTRDSAGRGALLLAGAVPLLTVPIDHLFEWKFGNRHMDGVALALSANRVILKIRR
jgi:hypothetical protein